MIESSVKDNHQINLECASMLGYKYGPYLDRGKWKVWIEVGESGREFNSCDNQDDFVFMLKETGINFDLTEMDEFYQSGAGLVRAVNGRKIICRYMGHTSSFVHLGSEDELLPKCCEMALSSYKLISEATRQLIQKC